MKTGLTFFFPPTFSFSPLVNADPYHHVAMTGNLGNAGPRTKAVAPPQNLVHRRFRQPLPGIRREHRPAGVPQHGEGDYSDGIVYRVTLTVQRFLA